MSAPDPGKYRRTMYRTLASSASIAQYPVEEVREWYSYFVAVRIPRIAEERGWPVALPSEGYVIRDVVLDITCGQPWETVLNMPPHLTMSRQHALDAIDVMIGMEHFSAVQWNMLRNMSFDMRCDYNMEVEPWHRVKIK